MFQLITDKSGFTHVALFQVRSKVVILNCTGKNLTIYKELIKIRTVSCRKLKKILKDLKHLFYKKQDG
jgi:hypothetical protein